MDAEKLEQRLAGIEARLRQLELQLPKPAAPIAPAAVSPPNVAEPPPPGDPEAARRPLLITNILGWGGAVALVLAAAYLIRLAVESGWLTPARQVASAAVFGLVLIAGGFALRSTNRQYAGLLPAGGIVILFLAIYGAHLFYGLILATPAAASVVIVCALSLWLCRAFASDLYALFAVVGSYSAPLLIAGAPSITDLVIYFSAWGVVFSVFSIWHGQRLIYLVALYLALLVFDFIRNGRAPDAWIAAVVFQTVQFAIFGVATIAYSIRRNSPLDAQAAAGHLPPLLIFYFLQYALLDRHLPQIAPWVAVGSGFAVAGLYAIARAALKRPLPGGEFLLWAYLALVLLHAGYLESLPDKWAPWVGFIVMPIAAAVTLRPGINVGPKWPIWIAVGVIFLINYLRVVFDTDLRGVPARALLAVAYALQLYLGYWLIRGRQVTPGLGGLVLYAGHIAAMAAALHLLKEPIVESAAWGLLALACLGVSLWQRDRVLGQSSLLVFGAAAGKVMLYDLGGASPMARILSLVVLGVTFYVGGLLYQRLQGTAQSAERRT